MRVGCPVRCRVPEWVGMCISHMIVSMHLYVVLDVVDIHRLSLSLKLQGYS